MKEIKELKEAAQKHLLYQNILDTDGKIVIGRGRLDSPDFLMIGEAPGKTENKEGIPFCGPSGKILNKWLAENDIKSFAIMNAVPIIPLQDGKIRAPTDEEIAYFRPYTNALIKAISPKYIVAVGKSAAKFLEVNFKNTTWQDNIGFIYHPAYYLRNGADGLADFKRLVSQLKTATKLQDEFVINKQTADNHGHSEMISGLLAGLHVFAKEANV